MKEEMLPGLDTVTENSNFGEYSRMKGFIHAGFRGQLSRKSPFPVTLLT